MAAGPAPTGISRKAAPSVPEEACKRGAKDKVKVISITFFKSFAVFEFSAFISPLSQHTGLTLCLVYSWPTLQPRVSHVKSILKVCLSKLEFTYKQSKKK